MQGLWYGDRRDQVKWGALADLAGRFKIASVVQIAYLRKTQAGRLSTDEGAREINRAVLEHFANLKGIERLEPRLDAERFLEEHKD